MRTLRALVCLGVCALLVACASHKPRRSEPARPVSAQRSDAPSVSRETSRPQSERYRQNSDNGPAAPPIDVSKIPEPVPKVEPRSRYGNKASYSVLGKTYRVLPDVRGYDEKGVASWYGNKFHGYMTSSFEPYDMYAFTAAHKTLPLPSYARVTNLDNGKSVVVRINDRGPFHDNRIIDLSYAAAVKIGVWPKGTGRVEVRAIDPARPDMPSSRTAAVAATVTASPNVPAPTSRPSALTGSSQPRIYLQLGAFGDRENAERSLANAKHAGLEHVDIESTAVAGRSVHRVRIGPIVDVAAANVLAARIERLGLGAPRVTIER